MYDKFAVLLFAIWPDDSRNNNGKSEFVVELSTDKHIKSFIIVVLDVSIDSVVQLPIEKSTDIGSLINPHLRYLHLLS